MTPISVITLAPASLSEVDDFAGYVQQQLEDGSIDPLDIYARCKGMVKAMEACIAVLQEKATEEAQKYGKSFDRHTFHCEVKEVGVKYLFDNCNDPEYLELSSRAAQLTKEIENRAKFLKSLGKAQRVVDEETGDSYVINPPVKTGKTSVTVELK